MKKIVLLIAGLLWSTVHCTALFADSQQFFNWALFLSGSWDESASAATGVAGNLYNRADIKLNFLNPGLVLRGEVLGRHFINFEHDPPWGDPINGILNLNSGLYHKPTGSRLLFGVLDEWGLSARIRNPWIRSPPYAENHKPLMADIKTAASGTKNDEAYLYLSTPFINLTSDVKLRGFFSTQTEIEYLTPTFSGGVDIITGKTTRLLLEAFYTGVTLPSKNGKTWFSDPPSLPDRDFKLYSMGLLFNSPFFSISSDWAYSETFAWEQMYTEIWVFV